MKKEVKEFVEEYTREGWTAEWSGKGHIKLTTPNGLACGTVPSTPSDFRSMENCRSDLRRVLRSSLEREAKLTGTEVKPPLASELKWRQMKDDRNMRTMTHQPFMTLTHLKPVQTPPAPAAKEKINIHQAYAMFKEQRLHQPDLTVERAAARLFDKFDIVTSLNIPVSSAEALGRFLDKTRKPKDETAQKAEAKPHKEEKVEKAEAATSTKQPKPGREKPASSKEIDETMTHLRAVLTLPFDKSKKMEIILDLLEKVL